MKYSEIINQQFSILLILGLIILGIQLTAAQTSQQPNSPYNNQMAQQQRQPAPPPQQTPRGQIPPQPQNQQGLTQPGSESNTQLPSRARQIILGGYDDNQTRYQRGFTDGFRLGVSVGFELGQEDIPPPARWFEDRQREEQNNTEAGNTNGNGGGAQQNSRWFEEQRINRARNTSTETTSATEEEARWFYEHNTTSGLHTWRRNN